jgi:hypothetical protein
LTETPWLFFDHTKGSVTTVPVARIKWEIITYPDPDPYPDDNDPEDKGE